MNTIKSVLLLVVLAAFFSCKPADDFHIGYPEPEMIDGKLVMTFYVSPKGNDRYDTKGTKSDPLLSIQTALSRITLDWSGNHGNPEIVRIHVQQGTYVPGKGLSTVNMGVAATYEHYSEVFDSPEIIIEGGYNEGWIPADFTQVPINLIRQLSVLDGQDILHHVLFLWRKNISVKGFVIKGGNARNQPAGVQQQFPSYHAPLHDYIWKYGGGFFAILQNGMTVDHIYLEDNRADWENTGTAAMVFRHSGQGAAWEYNIRLWMGTGQTIHYTPNVNTGQVSVNNYDGGTGPEVSVLSLYVAPNGTDSESSEGTKEQPLKSIQYALERMLSDYTTSGQRYDSVKVIVKKGTYTRGEGLIDGNVGFYVTEKYSYSGSILPYLLIEGGYDDSWSKPVYSTQQTSPRNHFSVLDGGGTLKHVAFVSRANTTIRGFVLEGANANNVPDSPNEEFYNELPSHLYKYGGGMLVALKDNVDFDALYFENNRADFANVATALALVKYDGSTVSQYRGRFYLGTAQTHGSTNNVDNSKFQFIQY